MLKRRGNILYFSLLSFIFLGCSSTGGKSKKLKVGDSGLARARQAQTTKDISSGAARTPAAEKAPTQTQNTQARVASEQSITVSLAQVARDLKVSQSDLKAQALALNDYLVLGRMPKKTLCPQGLESKGVLCQFIKTYRKKIEPKNSTASSGSSGNVGANVPIRPDHFNTQQNMNYTRLMRSLSRDPSERVLAWVPRMLQKRNCPRNLSAATLRKLENLLPDKRAIAAMDKLYEHATVCLRPSDEAYHPTHLRQALLRELWGDRKGAQVAITRAVLATNQGMEAARTLYWAGKLSDRAAIRNQHWKKLVADHPLSYHALEVWRELKVDASEIYMKRPVRPLVRHDSSHGADLSMALRWMEALYLIDKQDSAHRLANWMMERYGETMNENTLMYVSALKSSQNTPLNAIVFLTRRANENPQFLNEQTLRMLFPRPFLEIFHANSERVDPFLLMSIARQESGFNPRARSTANAMGLLQLLPATARQMAGKPVANLYDESTNVALGVKYLEGLIKRFDGVELALAGYNAGPSRVPVWKRRYPTNDTTLLVDLIPFRETRNYVSLIVRNNYWYEKLYRGDLNRISTVAGTRTPQNRSPASAENSRLRSALVSRLVDAVPQVANNGTL